MESSDVVSPRRAYRTPCATCRLPRIRKKNCKRRLLSAVMEAESQQLLELVEKGSAVRSHHGLVRPLECNRAVDDAAGQHTGPLAGLLSNS